MALDIDPFYYTETMVKILREQGHSQHAMELAELILKQDPSNARVGQVLEEMKDDARKAFERFKNSGRPQELEAHPAMTENPLLTTPPLEAMELDSSASEASMPRLTVVESPPEEGFVPPPSARQRKISLLEKLLLRVERNRA